MPPPSQTQKGGGPEKRKKGAKALTPMEKKSLPTSAEVEKARQDVKDIDAKLKTLHERHLETRKSADRSKLVALCFVLLAITVEVIDFIFEVFKTLWYIALLSGSFEKVNFNVATIPELDEMFKSIDASGFQDMFAEPVRLLRESVAGVDFGEWWRTEFMVWSCPGGVKIVSWVILVVVGIAVQLFIARQWLFRLAITSQRYISTQGMVGRILLTAVVRLALAITYYIAQLLVLVMGQIGYIAFRSVNLSALNEIGDFGETTDPRCGMDYDGELNKAGDYLIIITLALLTVWYVSLFAGRRPVPVRSIIGTLIVAPLALFIAWPVCTRSGGSGSAVRPFYRKIGFGKWWFNLWYLLIFAVARVIQLTFGVWTPDMVRAFEVLLVADKYDDDPNDDDNRHEEVVAVYGRTRGLLYLLFPGGAVFAKGSEFWNDPALFTFCKSLELKTNVYERGFRWFWRTSRLVLTILVVFEAEKGYFYALLLSLLPPFILNAFRGVQAALRRIVRPGDLSAEEAELLEMRRDARRRAAALFQGKKGVQGNEAAGISTMGVSSALTARPRSSRMLEEGTYSDDYSYSDDDSDSYYYGGSGGRSRSSSSSSETETTFDSETSFTDADATATASTTESSSSSSSSSSGTYY